MACPHGYKSVKSCVDCMYDEGIPPDPKPPVTVLYEFVAHYDGHCHACNLPTMKGQTVAKLSDDTFVHVTCTDELGF